jgi:hypothetical protein
MDADPNKDLIEAIEKLEGQVAKQNELLTAYVRNQKSIKERIFAGLWTGFGTVIGATVIVSGIVLALKPLSKIDWISPIVDKVIESLEHRQDTPKSRR